MDVNFYIFNQIYLTLNHINFAETKQTPFQLRLWTLLSAMSA